MAHLKRAGTPIPLAPKAFAVLCTLARQPGILITKDALLDAVWGHRHVTRRGVAGDHARGCADLARPTIVAVDETKCAALQREVAGAHQDRMAREMRELIDRYTAKCRCCSCSKICIGAIKLG